MITAPTVPVAIGRPVVRPPAPLSLETLAELTGVHPDRSPTPIGHLLLVGRAGGGKTILACSIAKAFSLDGHGRVAVVSTTHLGYTENEGYDLIEPGGLETYLDDHHGRNERPRLIIIDSVDNPDAVDDSAALHRIVHLTRSLNISVIVTAQKMPNHPSYAKFTPVVVGGDHSCQYRTVLTPSSPDTAPKFPQLDHRTGIAALTDTAGNLVQFEVTHPDIIAG